MEFLDELKSLKEQLMFKGKFEVPKGIDRVVIAGMGGSGIGNRIFQELYTERQVSLVDDYAIPGFVGRDTLFIAVSYSGNTEETLSALEQAMGRGAHTVDIASGGRLSGMAQQSVVVPKGLQPRSALGYLLMPLVNSFKAASGAEIKEAHGRLDSIDRNSEEQKQIAKEIFERTAIPVIYGISPYKSVAFRWKNQLNENAKVVAYALSLPEANHNDTMGLKGAYRKEELYFIVFTDGRDKRIEIRIDATERIAGIRFRRIRAEGRSEFARAMDLVHKGDYVSYHLANLRKKDPYDISAVDELKKVLGR